MEPLTTADLNKGSQLLLESNKKSYPVTVQKVVTDCEGKYDIILSLPMYIVLQYLQLLEVSVRRQ
jgi:hypothetical protein